MDESEGRIIVMDMPYAIKGCITKQNDYCTIFINARYTIEQQRQALLHELSHYDLGHLDDLDTPASVKESEVVYEIKKAPTQRKL